MRGRRELSTRKLSVDGCNGEAFVILILRNGATEAELEHVIQRVEALGLTPHISRGTYRTIIGLIGDEDKTREAPLRAIPGVADVIRYCHPIN